MYKRIPLTVAEYFAGIGLNRMGLEAAGWKVVFANDISEKKFNMYEDFFPRSHKDYIIKDIFEIDPGIIPQTTLATCSFPCIDLSLAGNRKGINGKHSSAFWGFIKVLKSQGKGAPPLVLVENVPGWLISNKGLDFRMTARALNDLGYVCDVFVLDALRFVPQSRVRVFLIGKKRKAKTDSLYKHLNRPSSLLSETLAKSLELNRDLAWFHIDIPEPPSLKTAGLHSIVESLQDSDARWWKDEEVIRHLEMMVDSHRDRVLKLLNDSYFSYRTFYRRRRGGWQRAEVRNDDLAGCLRTAVGGSGKQFLIKVGKGKVMMRAMTPREYARLQGVPDSSPIRANVVQALTGFGDAVCVPLIQWIGQNVLKPLVE